MGIDFRAFDKILHYELYYRDTGIEDRIWIGFPTNPNTESFFLTDRFRGRVRKARAHFSKEEAMLAAAAKEFGPPR